MLCPRGLCRIKCLRCRHGARHAKCKHGECSRPRTHSPAAGRQHTALGAVLRNNRRLKRSASGDCGVPAAPPAPRLVMAAIVVVLPPARRDTALFLMWSASGKSRKSRRLTRVRLGRASQPREIWSVPVHRCYMPGNRIPVGIAASVRLWGCVAPSENICPAAITFRDWNAAWARFATTILIFTNQAVCGAPSSPRRQEPQRHSAPASARCHAFASRLPTVLHRKFRWQAPNRPRCRRPAVCPARSPAAPPPCPAPTAT